MTYAPATWKEAQEYLKSMTGLPYTSLGLIHSEPEGGGYHEGNDLLAAAGRLNTDYSKRESVRDQPGTNGSSAIDIGKFDVIINGRRIRLIEDFNPWLIRQCNAWAPDTLWIREVIYTLDGKTVKRWDREGIRTTGDSSHLTHTHISGYRDEENTPKKPLFVRFFNEIMGADSMPSAEEILNNTIQTNNVTYSLWKRLFDGTDPLWQELMPPGTSIESAMPGITKSNLVAISERIDQLLSRPATAPVTMTPEDRQAIITGVREGLREMVREEIAARFADAGDVDE